MPTAIELPIAAHTMLASVLTLVMPLGVLVVVAVWYWLSWRSGQAER